MKRRGINGLSRRELEVLSHVAEGKQNKEVAQDLQIAEATVEIHLTHIYRKWGVTNRTEATRRALRLGMEI
jgi:DNA-binding NarL/FixJ family response regulator